MADADLRHVVEWMQRYTTTVNSELQRFAFEQETLICPICDSDIIDLDADTIDVEGARLCRKCKLYVVDARAIVDNKSDMFPRNFEDKLDRNSGWCYNAHDELAWNPKARDPKDPNHKFSHYQPYQRKYHFNERLKMRNNEEPRIPIEKLLLIRIAVLAQLPAIYFPDDIDSSVTQKACRAFPGLYQYAERWLQIRYFILTGLTHYDPNVPYDIPQISSQQAHKMCMLFVAVERVFDSELYLSSAKPNRRTIKDNKFGKLPSDYTKRNGKPGYYLKRHNIMQYNYIIHQLVLILFGEQIYRQLRTDFCFPLHKSDGALDRLNSMMRLICLQLSIPEEHHYSLPLCSNSTTSDNEQLTCKHCGDSDPSGCLCANELRDWLGD